MNDSQNALNRITEIINRGVSAAISLPNNPSLDAVACATAIYLGLTKMGKNISLVCASSVKSDFVGNEKIQSNLTASGDSLAISFPYSDGTIDKVDYNIQGEFFNLVITPRPGCQKLNPSQVSYSYTGGKFDFIIVIDSPTLQGLGNLYTDSQKQFQGIDIINIDRHLTNSFYGTVNFVNKTVSSVSELVFAILKKLNIEIDRDIATNLYGGIVSATNNFTSYSVNADTFEIIAQLLRLGAVKKPFKKSQPSVFPNSGLSMPHQPIPMENARPIESVEKEPTPAQTQETPQDWLKPKIFRGGGLV